MKHHGHVDFARVLRRNQTEAETKLWFKLREFQTIGIKFRRQHPLGDYVVDFVCVPKKLIIEIDGGQHNEANNRSYDEARSAWLEKQGFCVLRFWDNDVLKNMEGVMSQVFASLEGIHPHPDPLPKTKKEIFRKI